MLNEFLDKITVTEDNYLAISIKANVQIDNYQFSTVNSNGNYFINCIRDRNDQNCLLYYVEELTTLREYIKKTSFDFLSFQELILNIAKMNLWLQEKKLMTSNIIWDLDHVFIDKYTNDVKFIYIPVSVTSDSCKSTSSFQLLLKDLVNSSNCSNCDELIGFILSSANSSKLDISDFHKKIKGFKSLDKNKTKLTANIITLLSILFFCIVIPIIGNLLKVSFVKKRINLSAILVFAILFVVASIVSLVISRLLGNNKEKIVLDKKNLVKENVLKGEDYITKSCELNLTNIKPGFLGINTESTYTKDVLVGKTEYNPSMGLVQEQEDIINNDNVIRTSLEENNKPNGTQVLFDDENTAYIIKMGTTSLVDRIYIDNMEFVISRSKENCNFAIEETSISKKHATIKSIDNKYFIVDNNSSNGTYLNAIKLQPQKEYKLKNGDILAFAKQQFEFFDR